MTLSTGVTKRITAGVIKHKNALEEVVRELKRAYRIFFRSELNVTQAKERAKHAPTGSPDHNPSVPLTGTLSQMELLSKACLGLGMTSAFAPTS